MEVVNKRKNQPKQQGRHGGTTEQSVLWIQCVIVIFCIAAVLLLRSVAPSAYHWLYCEFEVWFMSEEPDEGLIRFAQSRVNDLFVQAEATTTPDNCSTDTYTPQQEFVSPLKSYYVSSEYGWRTHPINGEKSFHNGIDLAAEEGTSICGVMNGMVQYTGYDTLNGNYVILRHEGGVVTSYCHMQYVFVRAGEFIVAGQQIGTVGQTGSATGPHLHFVLKYNDIRYNPSMILGI